MKGRYFPLANVTFARGFSYDIIIIKFFAAVVPDRNADEELQG